MFKKVVNLTIVLVLLTGTVAPIAAASRAIDLVKIDTNDDPVPVIVQNEKQRVDWIHFRDGYEVPMGKRLFIDDVSIACTLIGSDDLQVFERDGIAATSVLRIYYPADLCPEELVFYDDDLECPSQVHSIGTGQLRGFEPGLLSSDMRGVGTITMGRKTGIVAHEGAILNVDCYSGNGTTLQSKRLSAGVGRLTNILLDPEF